jgi:hypothetical protein
MTTHEWRLLLDFSSFRYVSMTLQLNSSSFDFFLTVHIAWLLATIHYFDRSEYPFYLLFLFAIVTILFSKQLLSNDRRLFCALMDIPVYLNGSFWCLFDILLSATFSDRLSVWSHTWSSRYSIISIRNTFAQSLHSSRVAGTELSIRNLFGTHRNSISKQKNSERNDHFALILSKICVQL